MKAIDYKQIAAKNAKVDTKVTGEYERLMSELERLGVNTQSEYGLTPPLGGVIPSQKQVTKVTHVPSPTQCKKS